MILSKNIYRQDSVSLSVIKNCLSAAVLNELSYIKPFYSKNNSIKPVGSIAVITYANDAGGWFETFYNYYSKIFGEESIYVVTTNSSSFGKYKLGGITALPGRSYDDSVRSQFMNYFVESLKQYYAWTILCDVDEIIVPHPNCSYSLKELILRNKSDVLYCIGCDVIEMKDDVLFDQSLNKSILDQRKFCILNTALNKPSISRSLTKYSTGYHFCSHPYSPNLELKMPLILHLKYASSCVMQSVNKMVANVDYTDAEIQRYSISTTNDITHPALNSCGGNIFSIDSAEAENFIVNYFDSLCYDSVNKIYYNNHRYSNFLVKIVE